jgi:hypothetical protein
LAPADARAEQEPFSVALTRRNGLVSPLAQLFQPGRPFLRALFETFFLD